MSRKDTLHLLEESKKILEANQEENFNANAALNMILSIMTSMESSMKKMEIGTDQKFEYIRQGFLAISASVYGH